MDENRGWKGYRYKEIIQNYGGIQQRWLVVESEKRREADFKKLNKNVKKEEKEAQKKLRQLSRQTFFCAPDAQKAAQKLLKKSKYHQLTDIEITTVRIEALGLIMGLCLLVYTLTQRQLRQTLKRRKATVPNQVGCPTDRPTLRWIFQCLQSIHLLVVRQRQEISNLTDERLFLLKFFPPACQRYYLLA